MQPQNNQALIRKYNVPGPRYTSYPTVPYWDKEGINQSQWISTFQRAFAESNDTEGISLYIHLPFCESLCTFCGCHKHITKRHEVEQPYIDAVLKEWQLYLDLLPSRPRIKELHLGGGTPTFFSSSELSRLIKGIFAGAELCKNPELSFEGHPNHTSYEQLETLFQLGFSRCSFGVQDYDPLVQQTIHRIQPFEAVKQVTDWARAIGYTSISHDLVFGLPKQTAATVAHSIQKTAELMPDRISYYSYAHVPWIKGVGQRGYDENDLPKDEEKRALYELGKELFFEKGYVEIGMDHFALPSDSLYQSMQNKTLHRNFMGYSSGKTQLMIGLGMSAISDSWYSFAQNIKSVDAYQKAVNAGILPIFRGHLLTAEDLIIRQHILNIMCHFETDWSTPSLQTAILNHLEENLEEMIADGLVRLGQQSLQVTESGTAFVRNICMELDARLKATKPMENTFSKTV
jgi:oxygen-independent coproporphyrinogen-3 oxidase